MKDDLPADSQHHATAEKRRTWAFVMCALVVGAAIGAVATYLPMRSAVNDARAEPTGGWGSGTADDSVSKTTPPSTSDAPSTPASLAMGEEYETGVSSITVFQFDQDAAPSAPTPESPGTKWVAADVQVCSDQGGYVNTIPWSLVGADNGRYEVSSTGYDGFPSPAYPWGDAPIAAGECIRGWIVFVAPTAAAVEYVRYAPQNPNVEPMRWKV